MSLRAPTSSANYGKPAFLTDYDDMDIDRASVSPPSSSRGSSRMQSIRERSISSSGSSSPSMSSDSDRRSGSPSSLASMSSTSTINSDRVNAFFRNVCGRELNTMNTSYMLPSDRQELKVGSSPLT